MQKWFSKSDQTGLQKGPEKWAKVTNMASKSALKTGFQKNIETMMIFITPHLWIELWLQRELDFHFLIRCVFGTLLGLILEMLWDAKWRPRPSKNHFKKTSKTWCQTWAQTGPKGGPKMEPKSSKMKSWKHLVSRVAPKWPPDPLQDRFWKGFGTILGPCSSVFLAYLWWFLHAFFSKMLHQKNAAESFQETASLFESCHLALNSSLANVNELSGPC